MISLTSLILRRHAGAKRTSERGQISIFFASSLIVLISIIAFVINIGLFVKAKINLQNAVDAAAYSGAAVQSRMLTRIGYLNWEMRNVFKEWMFKYYVLGNLNIRDVENPEGVSTGFMSFSMQDDPNVIAGSRNDVYNFPSVCLHYAGVPTNVCRRYALPGIPRFEPTNLVGIDETTSSFIDAIVTEKSDDCSKRSRLNFNVTNMWAYQLVDKSNDTNNPFADAPQIAADRPGAWPQAVELAMRTRNLEFAVNRPPLSGVCLNQGSAIGNCSNPIGALTTDKNFGNERPVKAFYSAFRNLGNESDNEMKNSFTLTELSPTPVNFQQKYDLSTTLMLESAKANPKYYLDLKIMMVNYATFFTALVAGSSEIRVSNTNVSTQGACDVSKIAIPVPGYPLGFYKNPNVLTYYAVKGQARFMGLFNPFAGNGVTMTAWAAAKPMGGKIGPGLFTQKSSSDSSLLISRTTTDKSRSTSYLSGLDLRGVPKKGTTETVPLGQYAPGMPIPINTGADTSNRFWIQESTDNVGGWISGPEIVFGIPNLAYDFIGSNFSNIQYDSGNLTSIILPTGPVSSYGNGLYRKDQFIRFKQNLLGTNTPDQITGSILKARAPTRYEIANYTIPTLADMHLSQKINGAFSDNFGFATGKVTAAGGVETRQFQFYAPLFGTTGDTMFKNEDDVVATIYEFITQQEPAMKKYRDSLNRVAQAIFTQNPDRYRPAAEKISDINFTGPVDGQNPASCKSIAGQFLFYYFGSGGNLSPTQLQGCPRPLKETLRAYYSSGLGNTFNKYMYDMVLTVPDTNSGISFDDPLSGYMPGPARGANELGQLGLPFPGSSSVETMRRSGYSTKFVALKSLTRSGGYAPSGNLAIYSEGRPEPLSNDILANSFLNPLDPNSSNIPPTVTH